MRSCYSVCERENHRLHIYIRYRVIKCAIRRKHIIIRCRVIECVYRAHVSRSEGSRRQEALYGTHRDGGGVCPPRLGEACPAPLFLCREAQPLPWQKSQQIAVISPKYRKMISILGKRGAGLTPLETARARSAPPVSNGVDRHPNNRTL